MSHPGPCYLATGPISQLLRVLADRGSLNPSEDYPGLKGAASPGSAWKGVSSPWPMTEGGTGNPDPPASGQDRVLDTVHTPELQWHQAKAGFLLKPHLHPATSKPTLASLTALSSESIPSMNHRGTPISDSALRNPTKDKLGLILYLGFFRSTYVDHSLHKMFGTVLTASTTGQVP